MSHRDNVLVSTEWLAEHLASPDVVPVDASWYLPAMQRQPKAEYLEQHIPGAVFFDIDTIADTSRDLPHMLPDQIAFSSAMRKLGIGDGQTIVVYDGMGLFSAARAWWTFRTMGVENVFVLDGGLPAWIAEGRPVEDGAVSRQPRHFTARIDRSAVKTLDVVKRASETGSAQILDARPAERFRGEAPEPRPGLRSGHIPASRSLPFDRLVADGRLAGDAVLDAALAEAGFDPMRPVITSCGSGVTAALITLALAARGHATGGLYDGAYAEWGGHPETDVATGPA